MSGYSVFCHWCGDRLTNPPAALDGDPPEPLCADCGDDPRAAAYYRSLRA